jgi:hypothetical protein
MMPLRVYFDYAEAQRPTALVYQPRIGYDYGVSLIAKVLKIFLYERILKAAQQRIYDFHRRW